MEPPRSKRWLEWMIALIMASIMVLVFFQRVERILLVTERESVNQCLSSIRIGIQMFVLTDIARGRVADMRTYENTNPILLQDQDKLPINYAGEFSTGEAAGVRPGQWFYDTSTRQLVYRVSHYPLFEGDDRKELRYRLRAQATGSPIFSLTLIEIKGET